MSETSNLVAKLAKENKDLKEEIARTREILNSNFQAAVAFMTCGAEQLDRLKKENDVLRMRVENQNRQLQGKGAA